MIFGVGTDLIEIERIEKKITDSNFLKKIFSKEELEYVEDKKRKASILAGNFAVKESFSKALGTGIRDFSLIDISVLRNELGAPYIKLEKAAKEIADKLCIKNIFISISNTQTHALALCVLEK